MVHLSSRLPNYTGDYGVGVVDIEDAVSNTRQIGSYTISETGRPAFQLDTVLFSLYYPTERGVKGNRSKHPWQPRPLSHFAEGYARFAKMNSRLFRAILQFGLWSLVGSNEIPAEVDARLAGAAKSQSMESSGSDTDDSDRSGLPNFPVIIFSHGMASCRRSYTHYCGELASRGYIVAAIEHRDGSGPHTSVMPQVGEAYNVFHIDERGLTPVPETAELKYTQLAMREAEVEEVVRVIRDLHAGQGESIHRHNIRGEGRWLHEWRQRVDLEQMVIAGHSYGATLALQALKGAPSEALPFKGGVILDPGKQSGPLNSDISVPIAVVHSESWSSKFTIFHGSPHFDVVKDLVQQLVQKGVHSWFVTAKGTTHPSVTDAPLLQPTLLSWTTGATINVREGVEQYVKITDEFMKFITHGERTAVLKEEASHPEYNSDPKKSRFTGFAKYWQIHVAPKKEY